MSPLKRILNQSTPIYISSVASMAFGVLDTMMLGHTNAHAMQAMALATSIYVTIYVSQLGLLEALIPICSQLLGQRNYARIAHFIVQGYWFAVVFSLLGSLLLLHPDYLLKLTGDALSDEVRQDIHRYLAINTIGMLAANLFRVQYSLCTAIQQTRIVMHINLIGVLVKAILNYIFIFGMGFIPAMGSDGAAIASCIVSWVSLGLGTWAIMQTDFVKALPRTSYKPDWQAQKQILKLGIPMGFSYLVEISSFTLMALIVAKGGSTVSSAIASDAHQIMANLSAILYMYPMSLGVGGGSVVAYYIGLNDKSLTTQAIKQVAKLSLYGAVLSVALILLCQNFIIHLYTNIVEVQVIALSLVAFLPFFHIADVIQCVISHLLRAYKIAFIPFLSQTLILFVFGLLGGWYFGYIDTQQYLLPITKWLMPDVPLGIASLWFMCGLALLICGVGLLIWYQTCITKKPLSSFQIH